MAPEIEIYDTTLRDGTQGEGVDFFSRRQTAYRRAAGRLRRPLHRRRLARIESARHRLLRSGQAPHVPSRPARGLRLDAPQGHACRRRRPGAAAARCRNARGHDFRQDLAAPRARSAADHAGGKPRDDRRHRALPEGAREVRGLRRGARVRRLQGRPRATPWPRGRPPKRAGADVVTLCDTNGGSLPNEILRDDAPCSREPSGRGSASTLTTTSAWASPTRSRPSRRGASHIQGTINGYGERTGNCNLTSVMPIVSFKLKKSAVPEESLGAAEGAVAIRGRDGEHPAESAPAVGRRRGVLAQGRNARERRPEGDSQLRAHRSGARRQQAPRAHQRSRRPQQHRDESARARLRHHQPDARAAGHARRASRFSSIRATSSSRRTDRSPC